MRLLSAVLALSVSASLVGGASVPRTPTPVLVELFTSEGCSSCPPADALLATLVAPDRVPGAEVIVLSEHVDYWNRLGWADPFSSPQFSDRQKGYAQAFRQPRIYTPQMVVDGRAEFVGSDARRAREEIAKAAREPKAQVVLRRDGEAAPAVRVRVAALPSGAVGEAAEVLLAIVEDGVRSDVRRGENAGRQLLHAAVVRRLDVIGVVRAAPEGFERRVDVALDGSWNASRLRAVVFVQERQSRRILGAAQVAL